MSTVTSSIPAQSGTVNAGETIIFNTMAEAEWYFYGKNLLGVMAVAKLRECGEYHVILSGRKTSFILRGALCG